MRSQPSSPGFTEAAGKKKAKPAVLLTTVIALTLVHWALLLFDTGLLERLPFWHWQRFFTPLPMWWIALPVAAIVAVVAHRVLAHPERTAGNVVLLVLSGYCIQFSFGHMPGLGMYGLTSRMTQTDHAAFARAAVSDIKTTNVLRDYYKLIESGRLPLHPHSTKPPGQLLFYMMTERASRILPGARKPLDRLTFFAALTYPLLTYLALVPLYFLSRMLLPRKYVFVPLLLYILVPNVTLMTLHLDQCLYPTLFMTSLCLFLYGFEKHSLPLCFIAGLTACAGMFVSFSLVPLLAFPVIYAALLLPTVPPRRSIATLSPYFLGLLCGSALLYFAAGYNPVAAYALAMARHHGAKITDWTPAVIVCIGTLDILEFAVWIGVPLFILSAIDMAGACQRLRGRRLDRSGAVSLALFTIVMLMAFAGRTAAETGRLWLFIVPLVCLSAGRTLCTPSPQSRPTVFLALQFITALLMKAFHDFY